MFRQYSSSPEVKSNISSPRIVKQQAQCDPFCSPAASALSESPTDDKPTTNFVRDCIDNASNYTGPVDHDVYSMNSGLDPREIDPANPQYSKGSPVRRKDLTKRAAQEARENARDRETLDAAAILMSMYHSGQIATATSAIHHPRSGTKRAAHHLVTHHRDGTSSGLEAGHRAKRQKTDRLRLILKKPTEKVTKQSTADPEPVSEDESVQQPLAQPATKRSERILDPTIPEHARLIAAAPTVGADYYDSDADDLPGPIKGISKSNLFRNVAWGSNAIDMTNDADFPTLPTFRQFVPGRFERLEDGTAFDQKAKLVIKLTDGKGKKHIYVNPPPRDWYNQEAITALNKRTVQQIRRTTEVQFRARVPEYIDAERHWLLANLTNGKPTSGWKRLVADFNQQFAGKVVQGAAAPRPARTQSSLSKEVGRFGTEFYSKGLVPVLAKKVKKEQMK